MICQGGFVKVRYAGTGFLMIRREVLERMCAHYPQLKYRRDHSLDAATASENRFALFDCMIADDGTYLSEDFAFCKRWSDMGGEIWADRNSALSHVGPITFRGDLSSQFAGSVVEAPLAPHHASISTSVAADTAGAQDRGGAARRLLQKPMALRPRFACCSMKTYWSLSTMMLTRLKSLQRSQTPTSRIWLGWTG